MTVSKSVCLGCGLDIWFRDGYWIDIFDPSSGSVSDTVFNVAHLCDKPAPGSTTNRHVPRHTQEAS